jgi:hypothetical protein
LRRGEAAAGNSKSGWDDKGNPQDQAEDGGERLQRSSSN